jgi:2-polyprenyl-6-methoxyphenol hydroxylase-like FAD-dependent oxidoreductase
MSISESKNISVVVIGAGTGGLALAHGLRRHGISVAVYERDRTRRDGLQGYRVGISPAGKRALRALLPPELYSTFLATCARRPTGSIQYTESRKVLFEALSLTEGDPDESVSRMTLRQILLTGLEDVVTFDKTFTHYEQHSDGTVTTHFADGTSATGHLLVGADGTNSRVRRQRLPEARLTDTGLVGITGKVPLTGATRALLTPEMLDRVSMIQGDHGKFTIVHVMQFPWDAAGRPRAGIGATDAELLRAWPGLTFDNSRDYIMWGFAAARRWLPDDVLRLDGPALHRLVGELTAGWHPDFRALFAAADPSTCWPISIRTAEPLPAWEPNTVTLLGDAIHTMTPGRGVGANTALRDARHLRDRLIQVRDGELELVGAVGRYEEVMREYGFAAVLESRKYMDGAAAVHRSGPRGALARAMGRTVMRTLNHLPPVKRRMVAAEAAFRTAD